MNPDDFVNLVARMRAKQKDYFRTKNPTTLAESKDLERRVDAAVEAIRDKATPRLFDADAQEGE